MLSKTECKWREGKKRCTWYVRGCINKNVSTETKIKCGEWMK
jgi:hypothetical protein